MKKFSVVLLSAVLFMGLVWLTGCGGGGGAVVKDGDTISVEYTGTLADGTEFDSNVGGDPLVFTVGKRDMIAGFDKAVVGMKVNETKTVTLPPEEAYGEYRNDLLIEFEKARIPEGMDPQVGDELPMQTADGRTFIMPVVKVSDTSITLDANHELAGKELTFKIKVLEIK